MKRSVNIVTLRLKLLLLCSLYLALGTARSQTYPVSAQLSTMPPYSISFMDYSMGSNIQLSLVDRQVTNDMRQVYLNIELEGGGIKLKTLPSFRPSTYIDVVPGNMLTLTNTDLAEYFNLNSLSFEGISKEAFAANGQLLPEGLYKLKIKAIHLTMGVQVSNEAMAIMGLFKGQPPFINLPMNNSKVNENPTQNFSINWTNRNSANFNQANLPSYRIQMWEMLDPTQDPNIIVNSNYPPILDDFTNLTTYQHGPSNTSLTTGKVYVLRVQVLDPDGRDVYSNGGYSQVVKFTYGDACNPPTNLAATLDTRGIAINWALTPNQGGYRLQYGRIDTAWTDADVLINRFQIEKTYPSAQYQIRVASMCQAGKQSDYSDIVYISTKPSGPDNLASCGDPFPKIEFKNSKLLPTLNVGDKFTAYDFDVTVTRILRNDSTSYKGEGTTPFNMLGGAQTVVYFDGIQINTDRQLIGEGVVKFQQKPYVFSDKNIKQFKEDFKDTKEMMTGDDSADPESVKVDVTIGTVTYDSTKKQIVVNDTQGNSVKTLSSGKDYKITDKDGNVYLVSKDNKITKQPKATETTVKNGGPVKDGGANTDLYFVEEQPVLTFAAHPNQTWSFDAMEMNSMADILYESVSNDQQAYYVPYKSIGSAGSDKVLAKVYANPKNVDLKRIKFKTNTGIAVPFVYDSLKKEWTLTLTGTLHRQDFSVFPFYGNGKDTLCGKLNVMPLDKKEVNLVLVPINGYKTSNLKTADIEVYLNKVYNQANIAYKVSLDKAFSSPAADLALSVEHGKLEGEYSDNQAQVIVDYQVAHPEEDNTIYLFLCKEGSNSAVKGHTPVNRSYGFLFGETLDQRTYAHEVGHGYPLALEHPFTSGGATGTYTNLMDYASGTNLSFKQWGLAHNPKLKVRFGQGSDQGEIRIMTGSDLGALAFLKNDDKKTITFVSPANRPISFVFSQLESIGFALDDEISGDSYRALSNGSLLRFTVNKTTYQAYFRGNQFLGYAANATSEYYPDKLTKTIPDKKIVVANPIVKNAKIAYVVRKVDWLKPTEVFGWPSEEHNASGSLVGSIKDNVYFNDDDKKTTTYYDENIKYNQEVTKFLSYHEGIHNELILKALILFVQYIYKNNDAYQRYQDCNVSIEPYSTSDISGFYQYVVGKYKGPLIYVDKFPEYFETYLYDAKVAIENDKKTIRPPYDDWVKTLNSITTHNIYTSAHQTALTKHLAKVKCLDKNFRDIYKDFSVDTRIEVLKILATGKMLGPWFGFANNAESYVSNVIEHIKPEQVCDFIEKLENTNIYDDTTQKNLVAAIVDKSQLDDYTSIMLSLTNLAQNCTQKANELFANEKFMDRSINWNNDKETSAGAIRVKGAVFDYAIAIDNTGIISIKLQQKKSWQERGIAKPARTVSDYSWVDIDALALKPFDLVWLVQDLKLDDDELNVIGGKMVIVPAITLFYANEKIWLKNVLRTGEFTIDLIAVATSGKSLFMARYGKTCATSLSYGRKAWLMYELGSSSIKMAINVSELEYNKDYKEAVTIFNMVTNWIDRSEKGVSLLKDRKTIMGKIMKSGQKLSTASKNGLLACVVAYSRLRENLKASRTVLKTAEARKFMNNYEEFVDDCKKNWKDWYGVDFPINFERGYFTDVDEFADHLRWDANLTATFKNEIKTNAALQSLFSEANNTEWSQYAEAWKILSADKSMRGNIDDLNAVLKHLRETPSAKTDDLVSSFASALNKRAWLNGLGATVQNFTDDVDDFVFTLGRSEDLANVKSWLGKVDDGKTYLAVHGSGNDFLVLHNGTTVTLTHRSLARWITENKSIAKNSELVLLSCANGTVAQNLANKLKGDYKITSWDGKVKVYDNGHIEGIGECYSYKVSSSNSLNREKVTSVPKGVNNSTIGGKFVYLGGNSPPEVLAFSKITQDNYKEYFKDITNIREASNCKSNCTVVALSAAKRMKGEPILDASKFDVSFVGKDGEQGINILESYVVKLEGNPKSPLPYFNKFPHRVELEPSEYLLGLDNRVHVKRWFDNIPNNSSLIFASDKGLTKTNFTGHAFNVIKDENGIIKYFDVQMGKSLEYKEGIEALLTKMKNHGLEIPRKESSTWIIYDASTFKQ